MPPYVPGFTNDIFISYSHADNSEEWVTNFHERLSNRLTQLGIEVTIWRDRKLTGADVFSDEIFDQLQNSALLISIVSPQGIRSRWCEDERQAFERFAALNGGFRIDNQLRAIKVVKTPLPADQHRDLFGVTGFEFYEREKDNPLQFNEFDLSSAQFRARRDELALVVQSLLNKFIQHRQATPKKEIVYVATATPDLNRNRDVIVQQLADWGYAVVPQESEPPGRYASFKAVAKAELSSSIFSVHLAGDRPSPIFESGEDSIIEQYQLAQSLRKDRIVWVGPGRQLYPGFDDALTRGLQKGVEILKERTIDDLKEVIEERLNQRRRQPEVSNRIAVRAELYLICDRADHPSLADAAGAPQALRVRDYLNMNGVVVMPSPFTEMEWNELEEEYKAQLQLSKAVMLYWGTARENWFLKIRRIIVGERMRRNKTSEAGPLTEVFYFGSPESGKPQYRDLAEFVFEQYEDFEPNALQPLLDRLLANEGAG
jgi:TIR domain